MRHKITLLASAAFGSLLLASCGGGDGSTPTPTPTPTSTPTPTPTPTPTAVDFDFTKDFTATVTNSSYVFAYFKPTGDDEVWSAGSRRDGTSKITYEVAPESVTYEWPDTLEIPKFIAGDLTNSSPTLRVYRKGTDTLRMELPFGNVLRVSFEHSQSHVLDTVPGTLRSFRYALFFNPVTTDDDISANLTYTGTAQVTGGEAGTTASGVFTAAATDLVVSASSGKITGTLRIFETVNGAQVQRAALPISATVGDSGFFSGDIEDATYGFDGSFVGALAGADREEVFLIFNVVNPGDDEDDTADDFEFLGSLIGAR